MRERKPDESFIDPCVTWQSEEDYRTLLLNCSFSGSRFRRTERLLEWARISLTERLLEWARISLTERLLEWARISLTECLLEWARISLTECLLEWARISLTERLLEWARISLTERLLEWPRISLTERLLEWARIYRTQWWPSALPRRCRNHTCAIWWTMSARATVVERLSTGSICTSTSAPATGHRTSWNQGRLVPVVRQVVRSTMLGRTGPGSTFYNAWADRHTWWQSLACMHFSRVNKCFKCVLLTFK